MSYDWEAPGATALVVLAPEAEAVVGDLRRESTPSGSTGMEAHVTVLAPFRHASALDEETLRELTALVSAHHSFQFELTAVDQFDDGTVYLMPVPAHPFAALTVAAVNRFPDCLPYGGQFDAVVPHLTVGRDGALLRERLGALPLPISCAARAVVLVERGSDLHWHERSSFDLAASLSS